MKRRSFLGGLISLMAAPFAAKALGNEKTIGELESSYEGLVDTLKEVYKARHTSNITVDHYDNQFAGDYDVVPIELPDKVKEADEKLCEAKNTWKGNYIDEANAFKTDFNELRKEMRKQAMDGMEFYHGDWGNCDDGNVCAVKLPDGELFVIGEQTIEYNNWPSEFKRNVTKAMHQEAYGVLPFTDKDKGKNS